MGQRDSRQEHSQQQGTRFLATYDGALAVIGAKGAPLFAEMVQGYRARKIAGRHYTAAYVEECLTKVYDMVIFTGKAPWLWTELDFDAWAYDIFLRRRDGKKGCLSVSSQRKFQLGIKSFMDYILRIQKFPNLVWQEFGVRIQVICHKENMVPHVLERELANPRDALTHEEIDRFFAAIDEAIAFAVQFSSKDLYPLMRDKAMFSTMYYYGIRNHELRGMDTDSFVPLPAIPALGDYALAKVCGKGTNGSGPRYDEAPLTDPAFVAIMDWYLEEVRPRFALKAHANENALFLSERGTRISSQAVNARFDHILGLAGIPKRGKSPHSLRHSSVSHETERFSLSTVQKKHRHRHAATTQGYIHLRDEFVRDEIAAGVRRQVGAAKNSKEDNQ